MQQECEKTEHHLRSTDAPACMRSAIIPVKPAQRWEYVNSSEPEMADNSTYRDIYLYGLSRAIVLDTSFRRWVFRHFRRSDPFLFSQPGPEVAKIPPIYVIRNQSCPEVKKRRSKSWYSNASQALNRAIARILPELWLENLKMC